MRGAAKSEGASAPSNVLAFPPMDRARAQRYRKAKVTACMGEWGLDQIEDEGRPIPEGVHRLREPEKIEVRKSPELALLTTIYMALPEEQRDRVYHAVKANGRTGGDPYFAAALRLLQGRQGPC